MFVFVTTACSMQLVVPCSSDSTVLAARGVGISAAKFPFLHFMIPVLVAVLAAPSVCRALHTHPGVNPLTAAQQCLPRRSLP